MGKMIEQIRIGKTRVRLSAASTLSRFGPAPLITIPARGFWKCRIPRPYRRPHSITRQKGQQSLASRDGNHRSLTATGHNWLDPREYAIMGAIKMELQK